MQYVYLDPALLFPANLFVLSFSLQVDNGIWHCIAFTVIFVGLSTFGVTMADGNLSISKTAGFFDLGASLNIVYCQITTNIIVFHCFCARFTHTT